MLMDKRQTFALGRTWRHRQLHHLAMDLQLRSRLGHVKAGQDLDECGFAGSVLAQQAEHFARQQIERNVIECLLAAEALGQMPQRQRRRFPRHARLRRQYSHFSIHSFS